MLSLKTGSHSGRGYHTIQIYDWETPNFHTKFIFQSFFCDLYVNVLCSFLICNRLDSWKPFEERRANMTEVTIESIFKFWKLKHGKSTVIFCIF